MNAETHFQIRKVQNGWIVSPDSPNDYGGAFSHPRREWVFPTIVEAALKIKELAGGEPNDTPE